MLLQQPYDSKTLQGFDKLDLTLLVNRYIIQDMGYNNSPDKILTTTFKKGDKEMQSVVLYGLSDNEVSIPDLEYPLVSGDGKWIAFDMRKYFSVDKREQTIKRKMMLDFDFRVLMCKLSGLWSVGYVNDLARFNFVATVFARWISGSVVRTHSIDVGQEIALHSLALIYYSRLFTNPGVDRVDEREKLLAQYRETYYNQGNFDAVYELSKDMETVEDFCALFQTVTGSEKLSGFSVGVLYETIKRSWFGGQGSRVTQIALEYPPIFIAMVHSALKNNSFKRSDIGTAAVSAGQRGKGVEFLKAVDVFVSQNYGG